MEKKALNEIEEQIAEIIILFLQSPKTEIESMLELIKERELETGT